MAGAEEVMADRLSFGPFHLSVGLRLLSREGVPIELGARAVGQRPHIFTALEIERQRHRHPGIIRPVEAPPMMMFLQHFLDLH